MMSSIPTHQRRPADRTIYVSDLELSRLSDLYGHNSLAFSADRPVALNRLIGNGEYERVVVGEDMVRSGIIIYVWDITT